MRLLEQCVIALRILDQEFVSPCAVASVWDSLGTRLIMALNAKDDDDNGFELPKEMKLDVVRTYLKRLNEAGCDVLDAAWALNPENWNELRRLARSDNNADLAEWLAIRARVEKVLGKLVRRLHPEHEQAAVLATVKGQFAQYAMGSAPFAAAADLVDFGLEAFWGMTTTSLGRLAVKFLEVMVVTISNDERTHKTYSSVHSDERNRLKHGRVDIYARATIQLRAQRMPSKVVDRKVSEFFREPWARRTMTTICARWKRRQPPLRL